MIYQPHFLYRLKLVFIYLLVKLKFLHPLLPKNFRNELPMGCTDKMFWMAFKSGGKKVYFNYYCTLDEPDSYQPKVAVDPQYQMTEDEIHSFYDNGYLGPFDLIPPTEIAELREHIIKLGNTESKIFSYANGDYQFTDLKKGDGKFKSPESLNEKEKYYIDVLNSYERHLEDSVLLNLYTSPAIIERCAQLLGADLGIWHSNFFSVAPHSKGASFHQASRWYNFDMKEPVLKPAKDGELYQVTVWIALTDVPEEQSCLLVIPGSHKDVYPMNISTGGGEEGRAYGIYDTHVDYPVTEQNTKTLPAKAGQFFLLCERMIHGSTDNVTDNRRWAAGCRVIKADTQVFTKTMLENGMDMRVYGVKNIKLDRWKPILVRGKNILGYQEPCLEEVALAKSSG